MSDLPKAYDPSLVEEKWQSRWIEEGCFKADPASEKPAYSVVIPPPNVTGVLHLGHVLNNTIQDILVRRARQKGYEALWLPGTDHAGIATQVRVEKDLKQTTGRSRHDLGREAFLEKVWEWKEKHGGIIINQLHKLGCSCDWDRERFTMDEEYTKAVGQVFIELFKEGLIYRGRRMVNWCPVSLTALSDEEVIMTEQKSKLYTVLYKLEDGSGALHVATTRPETIMADVAVAVNPKDPRYAHLIGKNVMRPLMNQVECHLKERQYWKSDGDQHAAQIMKEAVRNLERVDRNKSFFMWIDCFDPHEPWDAPSVYDPDLKCPYDPDYEGKDMFLPIQGHVDGLYTDRELEHIRALYAEKVTMVDKWFGHLMNNIRTLGMEDDTLVILVSDHGSPMGKGEHGHGIMRKCRPWPYEELAHIPMIMRGPGLPRNRRVRGFVQSCDVAPTVVDWLGIGVHPSMQGHSLLPLAKGDVEKVREFAIAGYFRYSWSIIHWLKDDEKSVADARFGIYGKDLGESTAHILQMKKANAVEDRDTAFYNRAYEEHKKAATLDGEDQWTCTAAASSEVPARDELYCRKDDPFQLNNVSAKHPEVAKELFEQLKLFMAELRAS